MQHDIEYSVDQKREGKIAIRMWIILAFYLATLVGGLIVVFKTVMISIGAIIPLVIYTEVLCTWRFVSIEQKYVIESGFIKVFRKFGNSKPKETVSIRLKDAVSIKPLGDSKEELSSIPASKIYNALPSLKCNNAYAVIYQENGIKKALLIQVIQSTLKGLKYYSDKTVVINID